MEPREASPGSSVDVVVSLLPETAGPDPDSPRVVIALDGEDQPESFALVSGQDGISGRSAIVAPQALGDHSIRIHGVPEGRCVEGAALLPVSPAAPCPLGKTLEVGNCIDLREGTSFEKYGWEGSPEPPPVGESNDRPMVHPRETVVIGSVALKCRMDSVTIQRIEDIGVEGTLRETLFEGVAPIHYCHKLAVNEDLGVAVVSSRGTFGFEGGLLSFALPDLSQAELEPLTYRGTVLDAAGFEGLAFGGNLAYVAGKPDRLLVYEVTAEGSMELISETVVPGMKSAWSVLVNEDRLYLSSAGGGSSSDPRGELAIFSLEDPSQPALLGRIVTPGPVKSVTLLADDVIAAAAGHAGIALVDVSDPASPHSLGLFDTPGTALGLASEGGYLLLADWSSLRLYDATDRGVLRFLGASNFVDPPGGVGNPAGDNDGARNSEGSSQAGLVAASSVTLFAPSRPEFIVDEFNLSIYGRIVPGSRGAVLSLPTPHAVFAADQAGGTAPFSFGIRSDGTEALLVQAVVSHDLEGPRPEPTTSDLPLVLIPPMASRFASINIDLPLAGAPPPFIRFDSNDPFHPLVSLEIEVTEGNYAVGDEQPYFALPLFNECGPGGCTTEPRCFNSSDPGEIGGRPMVLAFFSSW